MKPWFGARAHLAGVSRNSFRPHFTGRLTLAFCLSWFTLAKSPLIHDLKIVHPGDPASRDIPITLAQVNDDAGEPAEFSTWVDSVICRDEKCKVVRVQLFWNALGQYQRYQVEEGEDLTKLDHVPFSKADHEKMQRILMDKESPLREVTKEGLTGKSSGVDGVAGATVLTLKANVVIGAGYSCYDLWHWANGEVSEIVRRLSGASASVARLKQYLTQGDEPAIRYALTHLQQRRVFDAATIKAVIACSQQAPDSLMDPVLAYLERAGPEGYYQALPALFSKAGSEKQVAIVNALSESSAKPPEGFFDRLSVGVASMENYYELHLLLNLVEEHDAVTPVFVQNTLPLLDHKKFFVARRAYAFLSVQALTAKEKERVDAFYRKHQDRL